MKTILCLLMSASMLRAQCAGCSSGGGGGGASATYQLTDFKVTLSGVTLTVGAGCTVSTPCPSPLAGGAAVTTSATIASPVGSGTSLIYLTNTGTYEVGLPSSGFTVTCTGCTPRVGTTNLPLNALALYTWTATSSVWAGTGTDKRLFLAAPQKQFVTGASFSEDGTTITIPTGGSTAADYYFAGTVPILSNTTSTATNITACTGVVCRCDTMITLPAAGNGSGDARIVMTWTDALVSGSNNLTTPGYVPALTYGLSMSAVFNSASATTPTWAVAARSVDNTYVVEIACYIVH